MSLRNTDTIDIVIQSPYIEGYDLIAYDSGDVDDPVDRYTLLIDKLTNYAQFVQSGRFYEESPQARGKPIRFCVVSHTPPNEAMRRIEAIAPRGDDSTRFPVAFYLQSEYGRQAAT